MWQFVLTDLQGVVQGEVTNADERKISLPHLRIPSASFKLPLYHNLADTLLTTDTLLKCYRTDNNTQQRNLAFHGPVVSVEEQSGGDTGPSLAVTAAGPFWRVTKRLIPGSMGKTGVSYGSSASPIDLGLIAQGIMADVNAVPNGYTGVSASTIDGAQYTASSNGAAGPWFQKNAAEAIAEIAAGLSSFEFRVRPIEPAASAFTFPTIGLMDIAPTLGSTKSDAIFEYGTGKANVGSYSRQVTRDSILTRAWISVNGWPDGLPKDSGGTPLYDLFSRDSDQIAGRGLFEEVVPDAGVTDTGLRTKIADFHLLIRKNPRQSVTFAPVVNARPAPFVDYDVGDTVRARAVVRGTTRIDALFRIWGVSFTVDKNGNENVELELVMP
jgi:hypothetical protein